MSTLLDEYHDQVVFGVIALFAVIVAWALLRPKQLAAKNAAAQAATGDAQPKVEYIPTSETYINSTSTQTGSGNTSAPGAPISITGPGAVMPSAPPASYPPLSVVVSNPLPPQQPAPSPTSSAPAVADPHAPVTKSPSFQQSSPGGWWHDPGNPSCQYLDRTQHYLCHGFSSYYWANGGGAKFGGPVSEEYRDASSGAVRQDFEHGTMVWQPGTDPQHFDVKWISRGGAGGAAPMPSHLGSSYAPRAGVVPMPVVYHQGTTHVVGMGQTIGDISNMYGVHWRKIYAANQDKIDAVSHVQGHPLGAPWNNIVSGMTLTIPPG